MRIPRRVAVLFCLLLAVPTLRAQNRPGTIDTSPRTFFVRGQLRSADDGRVIEMVRVDLKRFTGEVVGTSVTRSNGEFEFNAVPSGSYQIVVDDRD